MANDAPTTGSPTIDYHELLDRERAGLRAQLAELGHGEGAGLNYDSNFADSSQVTAERGEVETLAAELKETLDEVEAAIGRLDEGNYGRCEGCDAAIPAARLEAKPAARHCISCASRH